MKNMIVVKKSVKNFLLPAAVGASALVSSVAFAAEGDSAITTAIASGQASVELVVAGVIAIAALAFGLTMIVSWLKR